MRSCHNVGAMFRTADACGFSKLHLVGYTATPPKPQIDKVSLGAELWMKWEKHEDLLELIQKLKSEGFSIVGLEKTETSTDIAETTFSTPLALIVGNEVKGIDPDILPHCDSIIHIPMYGTKRSLNVSIAAGIAMYEIKKKIDQE